MDEAVDNLGKVAQQIQPLQDVANEHGTKKAEAERVIGSIEALIEKHTNSYEEKRREVSVLRERTMNLFRTRGIEMPKVTLDSHKIKASIEENRSRLERQQAAGGRSVAEIRADLEVAEQKYKT